MRISDWSSDVCSSDLSLVVLAFDRPDSSLDAKREGADLAVVDAVLVAGEDADLCHDKSPSCLRKPPRAASMAVDQASARRRAPSPRAPSHPCAQGGEAGRSGQTGRATSRARG